MSPQAKPIYVRFGRIPREGFSRVDGFLRKEGGVSAYDGLEQPDGSVLIDLTLPKGFRSGLARRYMAQGRRLYVIAGEWVGRGSDGEPLLSGAEYVREVYSGDLAGLLPDRHYLREAAEYWRSKRCGESPGPARFVKLIPPDELPPRTHREATGKGLMGLIDERVEEATRERAYKWGLGEAYERDKQDRELRKHFHHGEGRR